MVVQGVKEELELVSAEKDHLQEVSEELVRLIGEPDKPEVERGISDLDASFKALSDACDARQKTLDDALQRATGFHEEFNVSVFMLMLSQNFMKIGLKKRVTKCVVCMLIMISCHLSVGALSSFELTAI